MPKLLDHIEFETTLTRSPAESGWHFLVVSREIVAKFGFEGKSKRIVCSINGAEGFQCALLPSGDTFYIIVNKKKRDALGIAAGETVSVELVRDESKYGLPMPEELQEVLNQDPEGDRLFHALTAGKQRSLLYFIGKINDIDKRIHQALIVVEHIKENEGRIVERKLKEELTRPLY
jgi:hypothetical protein